MPSISAGEISTSLSAGQLERLLDWVDRCFVRKDLLEYTVEAGRPDSITQEKLKVLRNHDITRISINPQNHAAEDAGCDRQKAYGGRDRGGVLAGKRTWI